MYGPQRPIYCRPQYVVRNSYIPRIVPYIHPVVHINRQNIVNVPRHIYRPVYRNMVVDPGYPRRCCF